MEDIFEISKENTTLNIMLTKELSTDNAPAMTEELSHYVGQDIEKIVFNDTGLSYLSSAGIRVIFYAYQKISMKPEIIFANCIPEIRKVLEHVGVASFIKFVENPELKALFHRKFITNCTKDEVNQHLKMRQEDINRFATSNDVVCYSMKLGQEDE